MENTAEEADAVSMEALQFDNDDQEGFVDVNVENDENPLFADGDENLLMPLEQQQQQPQEEMFTDDDTKDLVGEELLPEPQPLIGESLIPDPQITDANQELPATDANQELPAIDAADENQFEMKPLLLSEDEVKTESISPLATAQEETIPVKPLMRSRKKPGSGSINTTEYEDELFDDTYGKRSCLRKNFCGPKEDNYNPVDTDETPNVSGGPAAAMGCGRIRRFCHATSQHYLVRTTVSVMNLLARILLWTSFLAMVVAVVWYSRELKMNGTDPHLIAWFSAGAFVLLGFPISMCGIFMHLTNYYQPNVQCYVVRILWMVPIYSIESWLW